MVLYFLLQRFYILSNILSNIMSDLLWIILIVLAVVVGVSVLYFLFRKSSNTQNQNDDWMDYQLDPYRNA